VKEAAAAKLHFLLELQHHLGGRIPFERWMQEALYHAEFGYYTASIREFGRQGDFTTWPLLNEGLARAIANWALEHRPSGRWNLIEIGAGAGTLAVSVMKAIGWWNRPRYRIVEISPRLRRAQQDRLGSSAVWHDSVLEALAASAGKALIFSNELVDAFPCRIFAKHSGSWRELSLGIEGGRVSELWRDPKSLPGSSAFSHSWPDGQRIEVRVLQAWLRIGCPDGSPAACSRSTMEICSIFAHLPGVEHCALMRTISGWRAARSMPDSAFAISPRMSISLTCKCLPHFPTPSSPRWRRLSPSMLGPN
jgi:hypothetical protein